MFTAYMVSKTAGGDKMIDDILALDYYGGDDKPDNCYEFKTSSRIPKGGHKVSCSVCKQVLKTKPDFAKSMCEYIARANGWKKKKNSNNWFCPKHTKVKV